MDGRADMVGIAAHTAEALVFVEAAAVSSVLDLQWHWSFEALLNLGFDCIARTARIG